MKETAIFVRNNKKGDKSLNKQKKAMKNYAENLGYEIIEPYTRKAVIYVRNSRKNDSAIKRQIETCQKYANEHNIEIVEIFIDNGIKHSRLFFTKFNKMVRKAKKADWDAVIVDNISRISKKSKLYLKRLGKLNKYGKTILSVTEDTTNVEYTSFCSFLLEGGKR